MEPNFPAIVNLLHRCQEAAIATHSAWAIDYPFASVVPFATDEYHRPVFPAASLAQHTKDLSKDKRSSISVFRRYSGGEIEQTTLVGSIVRIDPEPLLVERYLRYHPEGTNLISHRHQGFFRSEALQVHVIGKGEQGRWMATDQFQTAPWLPLAFERDVINSLELPANVSVLGVDCFGIDLLAARTRQRFTFGQPIVVAGKARAVAQDLLDRLRR
jgi:hypothetical protein